MVYLLYAALFSGFFPILILAYKRFPKTPALLLIFLVALGTIYEIYFSLILKWDSEFWFSLYEILSMIVVLYFFYRAIPIRKLYLAAVILSFFFLQLLCSAGLFSTHFNFDVINLIFTTLIVIVGSTYWFIKSMHEHEPMRFFALPDFYFISAMLLYHSSTFLFFMIDNLVITISPEDKHEFWAVNIIATLVYRLMLSIGAWKI